MCFSEVYFDLGFPHKLPSRLYYTWKTKETLSFNQVLLKILFPLPYLLCSFTMRTFLPLA